MASNTLVPLTEMFHGWPECAPSDLSELARSKFAELRDTLLEAGINPDMQELVYALRAHARQVRTEQLGVSTAITNVTDLVAALADGIMSPRPDKWGTYPLGADRRRLPTGKADGGPRFHSKTTSKILLPTDVHGSPLVPPAGGSLLVIWGGSPEVFAIPGVIERIKALIDAGFDVADVCAYERHNAGTPILWSLRSGGGSRGDQEVTIPDEYVEVFERGAAQWL
ncbi:MAG: hypothetical protein GY882_01545 [Actinomycetia bacterium]|nr:hypothetical protein [Actinomycetes bacterium]MCP4845074.1 hypothetical protein [Actinomycetes bacterium]